MRFRLPRQTNPFEISKIISREVRKQKLNVIRASKAHLNQILEISEAIQKKGLPTHLVCKKLPQGLGMGIFLHPLAKPILKGQIIAPYAGETSLVPQNEPDDSIYAFAPLFDILLTKEEQTLVNPKRRYHPKRVYSMNVDALKKGNFTRFINHSDKPNVVAELFEIPRNPYGLTPSPLEVIYLAKKTILPGEQLLVCYEDEENSYWGALKIKPIPITPKTFKLHPSLKVVGSLKN